METNKSAAPSEARIALTYQSANLYDDATNAKAHETLAAQAYVNLKKANLLVFRDGSTIQFDPMAGSVSVSDAGAWSQQKVDQAYQSQQIEKNQPKQPLMSRLSEFFARRRTDASDDVSQHTAVERSRS